MVPLMAIGDRIKKDHRFKSPACTTSPLWKRGIELFSLFSTIDCFMRLVHFVDVFVSMSILRAQQQLATCHTFV